MSTGPWQLQRRLWFQARPSTGLEDLAFDSGYAQGDMIAGDLTTERYREWIQSHRALTTLAGRRGSRGQWGGDRRVKGTSFLSFLVEFFPLSFPFLFIFAFPR